MGGAAGSGLGSPEGGGVISDFTLMNEGLLGVGEREEQIQGKAKKEEKEAEGRNEGHRRGREGRRRGMFYSSLARGRVPMSTLPPGCGDSGRPCFSRTQRRGSANGGIFWGVPERMVSAGDARLWTTLIPGVVSRPLRQSPGARPPSRRAQKAFRSFPKEGLWHTGNTQALRAGDTLGVGSGGAGPRATVCPQKQRARGHRQSPVRLGQVLTATSALGPPPSSVLGRVVPQGHFLQASAN